MKKKKKSGEDEKRESKRCRCEVSRSLSFSVLPLPTLLESANEQPVVYFLRYSSSSVQCIYRLYYQACSSVAASVRPFYVLSVRRFVAVLDFFDSLSSSTSLFVIFGRLASSS